LCASFIPLGHDAVAKAECNWYVRDINISSLSKKRAISIVNDENRKFEEMDLHPHQQKRKLTKEKNRWSQNFTRLSHVLGAPPKPGYGWKPYSDFRMSPPLHHPKKHRNYPKNTETF
jgi:hypothetical protein